MFFPEGQVRVQVYGHPTDMRKSYDGLYALIRNELPKSLRNFTGSLFGTAGHPRPESISY